MDIFDPEFLTLVKAARVLLNWSQQELADRTGISLSTINRFERGGGGPSVNSLRQISKTIESEGVRFVLENDRIGVTLELKERKGM